MTNRKWMARAWREPLVQFAVLGGLLYLASRLLGGSDALRIPAERLVDSRAKMSRLLARSDAPEALRRESDLRVVGDELLYREALRLGLERDDPVIRQHLAQKLLALTEDAALAAREPSAAEEQALFAELRTAWTEPARVTFCHVFAPAGQPLPRPPVRAAAADSSCTGLGGAAFPLGARLGPYSEPELAAGFGPGFARAVFAAGEGRWSGPVASRYGLHLVRVEARLPALEPRFDERRAAVRQAWAQRERQRIRSDLLARLARRERPEAAPGAPPELGRDVAAAVAQLVR